MVPLDPAEADEKERQVGDECDRPGDGIGPEDRLDDMETGEVEQGGDQQQTEAADANEGREHGEDGVADAAETR